MGAAVGGGATEGGGLMGITVRRSFAPLAGLELTTVETMRAVGDETLAKIRERTAVGIDADGMPFTSYSEGYAKAKAAERFGMLGSASAVDLELSGEMLANMSVQDVTDRKVTLGFTR